MTGILAGLAGGNSTVATSGAVATVHWANIFGAGSGSTNKQTLSGFTGAISVSATLSAGGTLYYNLNGTVKAYTGAFAVHPGDVLAWTISVNTTQASGNLTVTDVTHSATIQVVPYVIITTWNGSVYL